MRGERGVEEVSGWTFLFEVEVGAHLNTQLPLPHGPPPRIGPRELCFCCLFPRPHRPDHPRPLRTALTGDLDASSTLALLHSNVISLFWAVVPAAEPP